MDAEQASALRVPWGNGARVVLEVFFLSALYVVRNASIFQALKGGGGATVLYLAGATPSGFLRLVRVHAVFEGGHYLDAEDGNAILDRGANVASRRFRGRCAIIENYHVASFVRAFRGHVWDHVMACNGIDAVGVVVCYAEWPSAERVVFFHGGPNSYGEAVSACGRRDVGSFSLRDVMYFLTSFCYLRFDEANYLRRHSSALGGATRVLNNRFLRFSVGRPFVSSVGALRFGSIAGYAPNCHASDNVRTEDVPSKYRRSGAFGYFRVFMY